MGWFWYHVLKPKYGDGVKLLLSDTDSFIYAAYTEDGYQDLYDLKDHMDLSGYVENTPLYSYRDPANKKIPGKMSDEKPTEIIREVIALKPKMYSVLTQKLICDKVDNEDYPDHQCEPTCFIGGSVTAKGVPGTARKRIKHSDYRNILDNRGTNMIHASTIRSFNHKLYSINISKRGLSSYDDKKYILEDGISCLSYGHYRLRNSAD